MKQGNWKFSLHCGATVSSGFIQGWAVSPPTLIECFCLSLVQYLPLLQIRNSEQSNGYECTSVLLQLARRLPQANISFRCVL